MSEISEIEVLITEIKENCRDIVISQMTGVGGKPFDCGVWRFWNKNNEDVQVNVEVQKGMLWAIYANKEFEDKYPISATKICDFLKGV